MLERLVGSWVGIGSGDFPTLEPFDYREILEVSDTDGLVHYRQTTWRRQTGGEVLSHTETGFISIDEAGITEVFNAQGTDRVEVLRGPATTQNGLLVLDLESVLVAGDERVLRSWRSIVVDGDVLRYRMGMATTDVPDGANHVTAALIRS